jgi:membrane protease YdiL (CAAX protease family)
VVQQNLIEMVLLFVTFYLPGMLFQDRSLQLAETAPGRFMLEAAVSAATQLALLLYILWLRRRQENLEAAAGPSAAAGEGGPWARFGLQRFGLPDVLQGGLVFLAATAVVLAASLVLALLPAGSLARLSEGFRFRLEDWRLVPLALAFGILTGYREELFFRGYLITRFRDASVPAAYAAGASCLLFALGHVYQGLAGFVTALLLGILFSVLFIRRRNLHPLAIAHGLYNTMVLVASLWAPPR